MKLYSEMDAGEQREFLARRIAFGLMNSETLEKRIKVLAKRIHKSPEQVKKDLYKDATAVYG